MISVADPGRPLQQPGGERHPLALYRTLHGARDRHGRWAGEPGSNILNAKFYEVQKYMTVSRHQYNPQIVLISKKFWDTLNDEEKRHPVRRPRGRDYQRKVSREPDAKAIDEIKKTGMEVTELSPEGRQKCAKPSSR